LRGTTNDEPVVIVRSGDTTIDQTTVLDGFIIEAPGGDGIFNDHASPVIRNCVLRNSVGAGILNERLSAPRISSCVFSNNANSALQNWTGSSPTVSNCVFVANQTELSGGAMYNGDSTAPTIIGCVFSNNLSSFFGGAIFNENSSPTIRRCTFTDN